MPKGDEAVTIPQKVQSLLRAFEEKGCHAYLVGGCVRDLLRGLTPSDYDITTDALPEEVMASFRAVPTGLQHGTVTVLWEGDTFEVTTFRTEGTYADHRRPDSVCFTRSLEEDLSRRDFTVNAMALDSDQTLHDPFGGQEDLQRGVLRAVGEAKKRFAEDALRILRALRFAATTGFTIEETTARALREGKEDLHYIAAERILTELTKLLCGDYAAQVLLTYPDVLGVVLPELLPCVGFDQKNPHHCYDVWKHIVRAVEHIPPVPALRWAMLLHDMGKPPVFSLDDNGIGHFYGHGKAGTAIATEVAHRLKFPNELKHTVVTLVDYHDRTFPLTEKGLRRCLNKIGEENTRHLLSVKRADTLAQHPDYRHRLQELDTAEEILQSVLAQRQCFSLKQLAVDGRDMMALGFAGPQIGQALHELLEQVIEGKLPNEKEKLLYEATKMR